MCIESKRSLEDPSFYVDTTSVFAEHADFSMLRHANCTKVKLLHTKSLIDLKINAESFEGNASRHKRSTTQGQQHHGTNSNSTTYPCHRDL
jgi:hypothetical protein